MKIYNDSRTFSALKDPWKMILGWGRPFVFL